MRASKIAEDCSSSRFVGVASHRKTAPGTVLIRDWQGTNHRSNRSDDSVIYRGQRYQSRSEVARVTAGTRWSGPPFFGLKGWVKDAGNG
jgi:hypothetical protein